jgi:hypothetical protein
MSRPPITDELKVKFLERLVKNLYHGQSIEWHVHPDEDWDGDPNHQWGWVHITDLNDPTEVPKLFDCCDNGLSQDIGAEAVPDENHIIKELSPYRVCHHVDIYFDQNDYDEIRNLKVKVAELTKNGDANKTPLVKDEGS